MRGYESELPKLQAEEQAGNTQGYLSKISKLERDIEELEARIFALEEKERARSREEHDREMILDEKFYQEVDGH